MQTTIIFADGDQTTSAKFNEIISGATFTAGDINGTTLSIVGGKLQVNVLGSSNYGAATINSSAIAANAVNSSHIASGSVGNSELANLAVTGAKIALETVSLSNLNSDTAATVAQVKNESAGLFCVVPSYMRFSPVTAKAYGYFPIASSARSVGANSYNILSVSRISATATQVSFLSPMSILYAVIPTGGSDGSSQVDATVYDRTASGFKILHTTEGSGRFINFAVFGVYP